MKKIVFYVLCILIALATVSDVGYAHTKPKAKKKSKTTGKNAFKIKPAPSMVPTHTDERGTVSYYFFWQEEGAMWTHRTVRLIFDDTGKIVMSDTAYTTHRVLSTKAFSLQKLPLMKCELFGFKARSKDTTRSDVSYYVDDSVAMTVFNNSVTNEMNHIFLVAPLVEGNAWREKSGDSSHCVIESLTDSCITPMGKFSLVLSTVTRAGYTELRKYYSPRQGLVKSIFRAPGPRGHGRIAVVTEMTAFTVPIPIGKQRLLED